MTAAVICRYFLERNTRVFSQDPTVCRYIALAGRSCDLP
jgi:hypothetical protein